MKIHNIPPEDVLKSLFVSEKGLTGKEAESRLSEFGRNEIKEVKKKSLVKKFLEQFTHFLAILLWIASFFCFLSEYLHPGEGMLTLGLAIVGVIVINAIFTFIQEYRAEKALEALKKMLPSYVMVLRDGQERKVPAAEVAPGDIISLSEGDRVPADARLIKASGLMVNNAPLTGESESLPRNADRFDGELIESPNIAFAGTAVMSGSGKAVVFATGMSTEFGRIAHLTDAVEAGLSPLQREIVKVTRVVAVIATLMGVVFFALGHFIGRSFWENFIFAIGIIVANVPEGLLPTVTLSLAMGSQRMAKKNALIKTLTSVEALGSVTVICTDKTGTLTQNIMSVREIWFDGRAMDIADENIKKAGELLRIAVLCNNAKIVDGGYRGDPTETALLETGLKLLGDVNAERILEIPFDSDKKLMTTVDKIVKSDPEASGQLLTSIFIAHTKGAMETLLPLCTRVLINGKTMPIDTIREQLITTYNSMTGKGLRVLAFAFKEIENSFKFQVSSAKLKEKNSSLVTHHSLLEKNMVFAGLIGLEDPPRPEVPQAIEKCREAGIRVIMITGDSSRTAEAIAREIGLVRENPVIIEGHEFLKMTDKELRDAIKGKEVIFSRMSPKHKMRLVSVLKDEGEIVAVTGDGVNDAPALKKADVGIAMGMTGTDVAKESADIILLDDNFATIVNAIEEGRTVYENIRKFVSYIFSSNIPEIVPYLAYVIFRIPLPLTIIQILAVDLGTDLFPALALGAEKPLPEIMKQPPRSPEERLLNFPTLSRAYFFLGPIEAVAGLFGFFYVLKSGGWQWGEMLSLGNILYMQATTACLTAIIITQIANIFACRSMKESVFTLGFFSNKLIFWGIAIEILLQLFIVYHPWGNAIFGTSPIGPEIWLILSLFSVILFFSEELRKYITRKVDF
ncbi:MAG: cation-transporting P-type ATPase [Nitrospirae bacterium]|nr:cation-transporting P-type ATPase [Nitrospirota bacterium]